MCDDISADLCVIADGICKSNGAVKKRYCSDMRNYIFILDNIEINNKYRNLGIGSQVVKHLSEMIHIQFDVDTIILQASAYEYLSDNNKDIFKHNTARLVKFYKRCGFKHINNNIMFCKYGEANYLYN